jgi:predicted kinase
VIEGHGDLRPEHIYFDPKPTIIDCIEFNEEYRRLDVLDELCFLWMECDLLGAGVVGETILDRYCSESGDRPPEGLLSFYKAYRACVRAKVLALRSAQHPGSRRADDLDSARRYLALAERYTSHLGPPLSIVVRGLPGTGKSTLATALARDLEADLLQTDVIRQELFPDPSGQPDRYGREQKQQVYDQTLRCCEDALLRGASVVLDGVFLTAPLLREARATAVRQGAEFLVVECECPSDVAVARIARRLASEDSVSEATADVYWQHRASATAIPHDIPMCRVDTTNALSQMQQTVYGRLRQHTGYGRILGQLRDPREAANNAV